MKLLRVYIYSFIIIFSFIACNSTISENKLPESKLKNFNFIFKYGVDGKNQLDTFKGQYTKDMVPEPSVTTDLTLTNEEMNSIYLSMKEINILNYPEKFNPESNRSITPFQTYSIKIAMDGKEKNIVWKDEHSSETNEAIQLRKLFKKIQEIIENKEEYKKLPPAKGGYD